MTIEPKAQLLMLAAALQIYRKAARMHYELHASDCKPCRQAESLLSLGDEIIKTAQLPPEILAVIK